MTHVCLKDSAVQKRGAVLFVFCLFWVLLSGCGPSVSDRLTFSGEALGTYYNVTIAAPPPTVDEKAARSIVDRELAAINGLMSTYQPDSELSQFNCYAEDAPFQLSPSTAEVFRMAQTISEQSDGAFDITVGPLVNAWGFGPDAFVNPPKEDVIASLLDRVGYQKLVLHQDGSVSKKNPALYCDLSAIAKGYAVDAAAKALESVGISRYMVEVGGEIRVAGANADGEKWRLGIEKPVSEGRQLHSIVRLGSGALATSGNYRNMYEIDGRLYSHTIDPHTGYPTQHRLASASVIHTSCAMADGYATALMALGPEKALELAKKQNLAAMLIVAGKDGNNFETITTDAFKNYLEDEQ